MRSAEAILSAVEICTIVVETILITHEEVACDLSGFRLLRKPIVQFRLLPCLPVRVNGSV